jgi:hypothetical protein
MRLVAPLRAAYKSHRVPVGTPFRLQVVRAINSPIAAVPSKRNPWVAACSAFTSLAGMYLAYDEPQTLPELLEGRSPLLCECGRELFVEEITTDGGHAARFIPCRCGSQAAIYVPPGSWIGSIAESTLFRFGVRQLVDADVCRGRVAEMVCNESRLTMGVTIYGRRSPPVGSVSRAAGAHSAARLGGAP